MATSPDDPFLLSHLAEVRAAAVRIGPYVRRTPLLETDVGVVKPECLQVTGAFKARGAFNAVLRLVEVDPGLRGVAAVSSGNHGQAVALAARRLGVDAVVVMPEDAVPTKLDAVLRLGARVVNEGVTIENRDARFAEVLTDTGYAPVHPYDDWDVIHGQGTVGLEVAADHGEVTQVVVPIGGGGLASGVTLALKALVPGVRVVGVEPTAAADAAESFRARRHVRRPAGPTLADGARPAAIGARAYEVLIQRGLIDDVVTVEEAALAAATIVVWRGARLMAEPTGALPVAAVLAGAVTSGPGTVLVVSGGNVDPARGPELVARADPTLVQAGLGLGLRAPGG